MRIIVLLLILFIFSGCNSDVVGNKIDDVVGNKSSESVSDYVIKNMISDIIDDELYMYIKYDSVSDITNQDKLWLIYNMYKDSSSSNSFDASLLQEKFTNSSLIDLGYKNDNIYYEDSDELLDENIYVYYNVESNRYEYNDLFDNSIKREVVGAVKMIDNFYKENNRYIVKVKYLFVHDKNNMSFPMDVYGKWSDAKDGINKIETIDVKDVSSDYLKDVFNYLNSNYNDIKDKLDTYTYIFTYNNNKIKLVDFGRD